ncbi:MAG: hypothetical protein WDZ54_12195 [Sneathiella sp.]
MQKKILTILMIMCLPLFIASPANASWLDKLKETATELTDKAGEALKEAEPESPSTTTGAEGHAEKPKTTDAPAKPKAPAESTVTAPTAPKTTAPAPAPAAQQATAKAETVKPAAQAAELSTEGKLALEQCESNTSARDYYSCQCIAEKTESHIGPAIADQTKYWKQRITGYEGAIKTNNANANFTAEKKAQLESGLRQRIAQAEGEIAKIENRAAWDDAMRRQIVQSVELQLYKEPACKVGDGMREKEYGACMSSSSTKNIKGKTPEEYCSCSADTAAELWTSSNQSYSSKVAVSLPVQARTQCRK